MRKPISFFLIIFYFLLGNTVFGKSDLDIKKTFENNYLACSISLEAEPTCNGINEGKIIITLTPDSNCPNQDYTFELHNNSGNTNAEQPSSGLTINQYTYDGLGAGNYSVKVINNDNSCNCNSPLMPIEVTNLGDNIPTFEIISDNDNINCEVSSATLSIDPISDVTYEWKKMGVTDILGTNSSLTVMEGGKYILTVTNPDGCKKTDDLQILDLTNETPTASTTTNGPFDISNCNQGVAIDASSSTAVNGEPDFFWTGPDIDASNQNQSSINVATIGIYKLIVIDKISLCKDSLEVEVTSNITFPIADAGDDGEITCTNPQYELGSTQTSMGNNFSYNWSTTTGALSQPNIFNPSASNSGTYFLEVIDNNNSCKSFDTVSVTLNNTPPEISIDTSGVVEICNGDNITFTATSTDADEFDWLEAGTSTGETTNSISISEAGIYTVVGTNSSNGCSTTSNAIGVTILATPSLTIDSTELFIRNGEDFQFNGIFVPNNAEIFWEIENSNIVNIDTTQSQLNTQGMGIPSGQLFLVNERLFGKVIYSIYPELNGCSGEEIIASVTVLPEEDIFIPDLFTPNDDMVNDTWEVVFADMTKAKDYSAVIYSRSGAKVHEMTSLDGNAWTGDGCPDGVYYYYLKNNDGTDEMKGAVTILRN